MAEVFEAQFKKLIDTAKAESFEEGYQMGWDDAARSYERYTCKTENRLSGEGTTTAWTNMPESPKDVFKKNVDESLNELNHGIMQCETDIQMLWNEIEKMKERMPKEWK